MAGHGDFRECLLLFSGGLDTSCLVKWLTSEYRCEVSTLVVDVGQREDFAGLEKKAYALGAGTHYYVDAREKLVADYCLPAIRANARVGRNGHPLSASLTRPLIVSEAIAVAESAGIDVIAHGATGRANDSLRMDNTLLTLRPHFKILAPVRERAMSRDEELRYAVQNEIDVPVTTERLHSIDENLWAREIEAGDLESPSVTPQAALFGAAEATGSAGGSTVVRIRFASGIPVAVDGKRMKPLDLVTLLNDLGSPYGIGRFDCMEDRGVGVKVRELHEAPAATILMTVFSDLQELVLTREEIRVARTLEMEWVDLVLNGHWHNTLKQTMDQFFATLATRVEGEVTLRIQQGQCAVVARESPYSLDLTNLVSKGLLDELNMRATAPFIEVSGLQRRMAFQLNQGVRHA
ncbi:argininosuccinate synthase [Streptomyces sp. NPDC046805]|uniref:argininosuccinate synthase n=1 Tax=Streptomyces sp. NPDC046805 TaxID=3155134 RepID=UPI0033E9F88A